MDISLTAPISPHELPKDMRRGIERIVERIAARAAFEGLGKDLLFRIYIAGIFHGVKLGTERMD